ncbi:FAD-dependent oxidoreductase [Pelotomaculum propionicicum]|uniref:NADPH-Fe(3+) oxidoreductase subunit beta n=1 Tax=Pelotomaculum propionicicum TaxID=258475 RepID=A0A4Y7RV87_9FIRM|nr:FAD-dependent oxidoreductase [Pelotomaculum propionicicum]NLI12617.1 FAD-dependent oxidoreductase [Peptococcaceae bacterium]TEB12801.1 NADPH-Fe(3+) oxidoreductase subunit beta [Pelotomaculum propionicicum]
MTELLPPCTNACPVNTDVRGYLAAIARRDYKEAYRLIRASNPFPSVCAWVCPHPCEDNCRRAGVDAPLSIRSLKRFAVDAAGANRQPDERAQPTGKKVAVVGAGPGGLTAAYDLARLGHQAVVYERNQSLGGHFLTSLPTYRLPREMLQKDVEEILAAGVQARTGINVGRDVTIARLKEEYDAVIIGVGLSESKGLPLPGFANPGVMKALTFLHEANTGGKPAIGSSVIVIGGGDVAMDVARTAVRLGAGAVTVVCLEFRDIMPAHSWEIEEALAEGVSLIPGYGPVEVLTEDGAITGLKTQKVKSVFDQEGRFNPTYEPTTFQTIPCDTVILAIGQGADNSFLYDSGLAVNARGSLETDRKYLSTSLSGVFTCGEVVTGPGPAIAAVASGHRAAALVNDYLNGNKTAACEKETQAIGALPEKVAERVPRRSRQEMPVLPAGERKKNFKPYELGLDEEAAVREAGRCLNCGLGAQVIPEKCAACLTCQRVCPYDVPVIEGMAGMPVEGCQACGICAAFCPGNAITLENLDEKGVTSAIASLGGAKSLVVFAERGTCADLKKVSSLENVLVVSLSTVRALQLQWILSAFENGAAGVVVAGCREGECRYAGGDELLKSLIGRAKNLLESIGLSPGRLYYCLPEEGEDPAGLIAGFLKECL